MRLIDMNCLSINVDWVAWYVIQIKNRIIMSVGVSLKNWMIQVLVKVIICDILLRMIVSVLRHVKLTDI